MANWIPVCGTFFFYSYNYWLLYRLPELPDPTNPPGNQLIAPVGVDELMVEDGEHYLYWYKKL